MDEDLEAMTREQLIAEARRLRAGIRTHRDSSTVSLWIGSCLMRPVRARPIDRENPPHR